VVRFTVGAADFLCVEWGKPALRPTQVPTQYIPGREGSCHGAKRPGREAGHSLRVDVKNGWSYTYTSCAFLACVEANVKFDVAVCNQTTLLILYFNSSRLVTLLKLTDVPVRVSDIFYLTVSFKLINCSFHIFLLFVFAMSASFTSSVV
jgi:hypothetical protein